MNGIGLKFAPVWRVRQSMNLSRDVVDLLFFPCRQMASSFVWRHGYTSGFPSPTTKTQLSASVNTIDAKTLHIDDETNIVAENSTQHVEREKCQRVRVAVPFFNDEYEPPSYVVLGLAEPNRTACDVVPYPGRLD